MYAINNVKGRTKMITRLPGQEGGGAPPESEKFSGKLKLM